MHDVVLGLSSFQSTSVDVFLQSGHRHLGGGRPVFKFTTPQGIVIYYARTLTFIYTVEATSMYLTSFVHSLSPLHSTD